VTEEGLVIGSRKRNVLVVTVDAVWREATVAAVIDAARERRRMAVSALAVHGVMTGNDVQDRRAVKATGG